jgi:hypothetical protein
MTKKHLFISIFLIVQIFCFAQKKIKNVHSSKTIKKLEGTWIHSLDSLAIVIIKKNKWVFGYKSEKKTTIFPDQFHISIKDSFFGKDTQKSLILMLNRPKENEELEILGLSDNTFSYLDLKRGRVHLYYKYYNR